MIQQVRKIVTYGTNGAITSKMRRNESERIKRTKVALPQPVSPTNLKKITIDLLIKTKIALLVQLPNR